MKVSFDYDSTLSDDFVQLYAEELIKRGLEVWIVTSRNGDAKAPKGHNNDLYHVADKVGIPRENIHFTNGKAKYKYLKKYDFIWHLDDDQYEIDTIQEHTTIQAINVIRSSSWMGICERLLNEKI